MLKHSFEQIETANNKKLRVNACLSVLSALVNINFGCTGSIIPCTCVFLTYIIKEYKQIFFFYFDRSVCMTALYYSGPGLLWEKGLVQNYKSIEIKTEHSYIQTNRQKDMTKWTQLVTLIIYHIYWYIRVL